MDPAARQLYTAAKARIFIGCAVARPQARLAKLRLVATTWATCQVGRHV